MRTRYPLPLLVASLLLLAVAPGASADTGFSVSLNGAQVVGGVPTPGTGSGTLILNNAQTQLTYNITYANLLAPRSVQHIHGPAGPGVNAGVLVGLNATGTTSGTLSGVAAVTPTIVTHMIAGNTYVNIHSQAYPGGEIRGQIMLDATPTRSATWGRIKQLYR